MHRVKLRGSGLSSRPFYTVVLLLSLFAAFSFVAHTAGHPHTYDDNDDLDILRRSERPQCNQVHKAQDQCAFVKEFCIDEDAGLVPYLQFYYCTARAARPLAFAALVCWLGLLFSTIGIAASDFFSVNLSTIATILGLSESLAGVTFLAFGNGSPDVFSTYAAMSSNSAGMAVGELLGAASFITGVVAGSMALVKEFRVDRRTYARDIGFFFVAVCFTMGFLADGHLRFWECLVMIGYYVVYVVTVVFCHWYGKRRSDRRRRQGGPSGYFVQVPNHPTAGLVDEPYRDDPEGACASSGHPFYGTDGGPSTPDERPGIVVETPDATRIPAERPGSDTSDADEHERMVAAEVASSMRVLRSRHKRSSTLTPIRPSLIGALEFRSTLAQLQRESNHKLVRMPDRSYSDMGTGGPVRPRSTSASPVPAERGRQLVHDPNPYTGGRSRAWSSGDAPASAHKGPRIAVGSETAPVEGPSSEASPSAHQSTGQTNEVVLPAAAPYTVGGSLAPPPIDSTGHSTSGASTPRSEESDEQPPQLHLSIPSRRSSCSDRSSPASPFPHYTESPMLITPHAGPEYGDFSLPGPARQDQGFADLQVPCEPPRPVRWWPYNVLPPPHVLSATLFPTLQGWGEKTHWDKFVSLLCVPSLFFLVITLPVVESDTSRGSSVLDTIKDSTSGRMDAHMAPPISVEHEAIEPETEWARYRRHTLSRNHSFQSYRDTPTSLSPRMAGLSQEETLVPSSGPLDSSQGGGKATALPPSTSDANDETHGWSRWLVCVQLFTGPLFAVFMLWANLSDDWEEPGTSLLRMVLYTLLGSLVVLGCLLLSTSEQRKPQYHFLLCFLGFVISIAWISTIAGEVVGVLKTAGVVLNISEALLGLTIFAAGNSVGDLVANITIARVGYPVMALSACFGGPMLNILLGIGIGGALMMVKKANHKLHKHPDRKYEYGPYRIQVGGTLMISAITLLVILGGLLIVVPLNEWVLSRRIGWTLIAMWILSTAVNVVVELTGVWDIA